METTVVLTKNKQQHYGTASRNEHVKSDFRKTET